MIRDDKAMEEKLEHVLKYSFPFFLSLFLTALVLLVGDLNIVVFISSNRIEELNPLVELFTNLGDYIFGLVMFILLLRYLRKKESKEFKMARLGIIGWIVLDLIITNVLKIVIARPRPYVVNSEIKPLGWPTKDYQSFPSGHTVTAFTFSTATYLYNDNKLIRAVVIIFAILMGLSRIYCGVHYPTDVIAGALIGLYGTLFIKSLLERL